MFKKLVKLFWVYFKKTLEKILKYVIIIHMTVCAVCIMCVVCVSFTFYTGGGNGTKAIKELFLAWARTLYCMDLPEQVKHTIP